ncbi:TolC family protein [Martelella alba]|uniref:Protein CyaE n=1 Tax=Martelella alba TaxID=2590451 RepID=A0A506UJ75_9HYPH|nr:TolC family protein [Martelella alba]TPW33366.1 TolC family protein [Martelella alba]
MIAVITVAAMLSGCAAQSLKLAPPDPNHPWSSSQDANLRADAQQSGDLALPAPEIDTSKTYNLPELIDLAQRSNPTTRAAWESARQAALAVGMAEATYLPFITANAIGGTGTNTSPLPIPIGADSYFSTNIDGVAPFIALQWLAFDFGGRSAVVSAAEQLSLAANYKFNAAHQQLIFQVTGAWHQYNATRNHTRVAVQSLANARTLLDAVTQKRKNGLATSVDLAQAEQLVAQGEFRVVKARGDESDAYQTLLGAIGISPVSKLRIADSSGQPLPATVTTPVNTMIDIALARRPDILAGYAAVKASQSGVDATKAAFMPKIGVYGSLATYSANATVGGLPTANASGVNGNIFLGISIPLYDGGMREANMKQAESREAAASRDFEHLKDTAAREIVMASNALTSAIASHNAAVKMSSAAAKTYDSTLEAYRNGVGTVTAAAAGQTDLLNARLAEGDARESAFAAAANLAFVLGSSMSGPDGQAANR